MKRTVVALAALGVVIGLAGCSSDTETPAVEEATVSTEPSAEPTVDPTPTSEPEPEPSRVHKIGDTVEFESATIVVDAVEQQDTIQGEFGTNLDPKGDGSLWLLSMNWTNLSKEAVSKVCWGPYTVELRVFDTENREMLLDDDSGFIPGNECSDGLMTGQSGDWFQAFQGLNGAELGYITLQEGYGDEPAVVLVDESLVLTLE